jgi:hypothetical protein
MSTLSTTLQDVTSGIALPGANYRNAMGEPIKLTGNTALATLDPETRSKRPLFAATHEYQEFDPRDNLGQQLGRGLHNALTSPNFISKTLDKGPLVGGLSGALGVGALGYGAGWLMNKGDDPEAKKKRRRWGMLAALAGGAAGAYSGHWRTKESSWRMSTSGDHRQQVMDAISAAPGLSFQQRSQFMMGVSKLPDSQVNRLAELIPTVTGIGVGALVAKFLMGAGLGGIVLGGMLGGVIGHALGSTPTPKDGLGRPSLNNHDMFGNSIF